MGKKNEYPRPQFVREHWQNLNGEWQFAFDDADQGLAQKWYAPDQTLAQCIQVPFVYQCELSGIHERKQHDIVWYKRYIDVDPIGVDQDVILHFGAVDYEAQVFVNGHKVCEHRGGSTPFSVELTPYLEEGQQVIALRVYDPYKDEYIPRGKQFWEEQSRSIWYTGSTGIWQTVWLEYVRKKRIVDVKFTSLFDEGQIQIKCAGAQVVPQDLLSYRILFGEEVIARGNVFWETDTLEFAVDIIKSRIFHMNFHDDGRSWTPENPMLYDVELAITDQHGDMHDEVKSYFGFRKVHTEHGMVYLNNKPYYQKLVLDQGYWEKGLLTAPDDQAFITDINLAKEMGFNGCRKHQKVEDPRFLYWADRLGFIVWGESPSTIMFSEKSVKWTMEEWAETVARDYNHPCILVWVPCNESWGMPNIHTSRMERSFSLTMYHYLHALDDTRLVISNDGWEMTKTDICAIHNYQHGRPSDAGAYQEYKDMLATRESLVAHPAICWDTYSAGYENEGEPIMLTEFGGIGFDVSGAPGWGYTSVDSGQELIREYQRVIEAVYASKGLWGFCYTQLADVEQEINGLLTYGREPKVSPSEIKKINDGYHVSRIV